MIYICGVLFACLFLGGGAVGREGQTASCLQFPVWWSILKVVRTHFAACGGENRPNYFKNRPHFRKPQAVGGRLASCLAGRRALGGQFVLNFGRKNQLAILRLGKENFFIKTI